jgi:membrane associated rhomboid family serine protease
MLIPYGVKNPISRFPYATTAIIAINIVVFALTTKSFLVIRDDALRAYSFTWGLSPVWTFFTAAFLHVDIFHVAGNMLFLWVFGRAVEDRLGVARYITVYLIAGLAGDLLHALLGSAGGQAIPTLGASGCIMGLLGAYWYLFSWSPVCVFYFIWIFFFIRVGTFQIAAFWIIAAYVLMDVLSGVAGSMAGATGGVANFAHVGGAVAGALLCFFLGMKRDTGALSRAKASYADTTTLGDIPLLELVTMADNDPGNPAIIRALIAPALDAGQPELVRRAMERAGAAMVDRDPDLVATYLSDLAGDPKVYPIGQIMWLANSRQHSGDTDMALKLYQRVVDTYPNTPDGEMALYRAAQIVWGVHHDADCARRCIETMLKRFPNGPLALSGEDLLRQIDRAA